MIRYNHKSLLVYKDDRVVGEIVRNGAGWSFHYYKFGMGLSSALPTIEALMVRVTEYLEKV